MDKKKSVFGTHAEEQEIFDSQEEFILYHKDKVNAEKSAENSAKDLTDFCISVSQDVPDLSDEEINKGIERILEKAYPEKTESEKSGKGKIKKITFKVLFVAALLSILAFSGVCVVGSNNNINIKNGFVTFAKDVACIVFYGDSKEKLIPVDVLLKDLKYHGYENILLPEKFMLNSNECKAGEPLYYNDEFRKQVNFSIYYLGVEYTFCIYPYIEAPEQNVNNLKNATTLETAGTYIYIFDHGIDSTSVYTYKDNFSYDIYAHVTYSEMVEIMETMKSW